jgi:Fic family protein
MRYIHECEGWPKFTWAPERLLGPLASVRHHQGRLIGRMEGMGFSLRSEALLKTLTQDVLKTSDIEGQMLDKDQVRSSLARKLGLDIGGLVPADRHTDGVVEMTLDATQHYARPLTKERLCAWHAALFPTGYSGMARIAVGRWRDDQSGAMQIVSGPAGWETIHYQAPASHRLEKEMRAFLNWFNADTNIDPVVKAGLAHLWFVTVHPFEDGNGRIARAIADMALARAENCAQRFYSMSAQIRVERKVYYEMLENTQKGALDVTPWLQWFLGCLDRALAHADETLAGVMKKARFWERHAGVSLNERQRAILGLLLDGADGKLTSSRWAKLADCSQDTASRDIAALLEAGILVKEPGGGRSTSYALAAA